MIVIQMHGEPGSGKSTVANALAPLIDAVVLDKDVIKSALLRVGAPEGLAASAAYEAYFDLARDLLRQRRSVILDNPVFWPSIERHWMQLAAEAASPLVLIECACPDRGELNRRLATRDARESQPRGPLALDPHSGAVATAYQPRLVLDTTRPLADLVAQALDYVGGGVPA
jgi:predicted kinase